MKIDIISCQPDLMFSAFQHSMIKRAQDKKLVEINLHQLRDYADNPHKQIDDYAFGGGAGMVLMLEPIMNCILHLKENTHYDEIIYMTPDGNPFTQTNANQLSMLENIIILCGHYKGVDHRIREYLITKEISIGDYVLTGGELAATVVTDAIVRLIPGVLSDETSALTDSFQDMLLAPPVYTRPADYQGWKVPEILLSGDHPKIEDWRMQQAIERTKTKRPDLYKKMVNEKGSPNH